ncbi:MAG: Phenylalanine-tRNA ligase alpha subunit [candidate division TM6 bacterium GW2011_GWF2_37_49]|nr:MAG: Phenylalanine-tRNA ligase alpha subunit [candidate division TM6 bacterium GW2011_GWF2_37_49]
MFDLKSKILNIKSDFKNEVKNAQSLKTLDDIRIKFLGKNGLITALMSEIKNLSLEEKKEFGPVINQFKISAESELELAKTSITKQLAQADVLKKQSFDVSATQPNAKQGYLHPYTHLIAEIEDIFISMGYEIADGPEAESDEYNFSALNIPHDHPARDMYDTFWLDVPGMLMRTHTSPVQVHAMRNKPLPLAVVAPGKCYRHEAIDASHEIIFMQCEGMLIDKNISMANIFATIQTFLKALFKKDELDIRIRPGFFPFVEPGVEIDMRCPFCKNGCSVCKKSTWIELFPAGMIHPNVLKQSGINPEEYSGFAFGFGLTRLAMLRYGIDDVRLFYNGKTKFLEQF